MRRRTRTKDSLLNDQLFVAIAVLTILLIISPWVWRFVIVGIAFLITATYIFFYLRKINQLRRTGIDHIDKMSGKEFEQRLWLFFRDLGYSVQATPYQGDWGADLVISKSGVRTVVQAKRYSKPVGVTAIQEAVTARAKYNCTDSMVVTNSTFTAQARELAKHNNTQLWDREKLLNVLMKTDLDNSKSVGKIQ